MSSEGGKDPVRGAIVSKAARRRSYCETNERPWLCVDDDLVICDEEEERCRRRIWEESYWVRSKKWDWTKQVLGCESMKPGSY